MVSQWPSLIHIPVAFFFCCDWSTLSYSPSNFITQGWYGSHQDDVDITNGNVWWIDFDSCIPNTRTSVTSSVQTVLPYRGNFSQVHCQLFYKCTPCKNVVHFLIFQMSSFHYQDYFKPFFNRRVLAALLCTKTMYHSKCRFTCWFSLNCLWKPKFWLIWIGHTGFICTACRNNKKTKKTKK